MAVYKLCGFHFFQRTVFGEPNNSLPSPSPFVQLTCSQYLVELAIALPFRALTSSNINCSFKNEDFRRCFRFGASYDSRFIILHVENQLFHGKFPAPRLVREIPAAMFNRSACHPPLAVDLHTYATLILIVRRAFCLDNTT